MKKQNKKRLIYSALGAVTLLSSFSTVAFAFILGPGIINRIAPEPIINSDGNKNYSYVENVDKPYYFNREIKNENVTRTPNKDIYETPLTKKYGNDFKWPAWNYNYETDPDGSGPEKQNKFQTIKGEEINAAQLVYNDDVTDLAITSNGKIQYLKYSDPRFIRREINNNSLKKHPAADVWFEQQISDNEKAIDAFYSIPSSVSGPTALGLYAPPGEVLTLKFTENTFESIKRNNINNFQVVINSSFYDNHSAETDSGGISNRYPFVKSVFNISASDLNENREFKFGSPFGGTVSIFVRSELKSSSYNDVYKSFDNFEFNVTGGLKTLSYYNGYTTEQEWNKDLQKVIDGSMSAPSMSIDFTFGSMNISSTGKNKFAYLDSSKIIYPKKVMEKWNDFLFLSEYFAGRDIDNSVTKIDFEFSDDIWGWAAAWGGGNALYAPLSWAQGSFLKGDVDWTINNNWGVFHEINHNFQQNAALFNKISHGKTNEVTMFNLSLISDTGRWRDIYNPASEFGGIGHWTGMQNMYSTILDINENFERKNNYNDFNNSEYEIQNILLNTLGSHNYADYVRWDMRNSTDTSGLDTIVELSNYFGINFYPAFANFHKIWNDNWPSSYKAANAQQKKKIDSLSNLNTQDFVANIYAAGPYLFNSYDNTLTYTNDMQPAFEIPAGKPYTFDFEKGIISPNLNFNFSELIFDSQSKLGGSLKLDPNNHKKLIYTPNQKSIDKIDEFDVGIKVKYPNMPSNYVHQLRWKIKVRQVTNQPVITLYKDNYPKGYNTGKITDDYSYLKDPANFVQSKTSDPRKGPLSTRTDKENWHRYKISFSFIAPKTGDYKFQIKTRNGNWFMDTFIVNSSISSDIWWKSTSNTSNWTDTKTIRLNKDQLTTFEIYTHTELSKSSKVDFRAIIDNDTQNPIDVFDNAVVPWANQLSHNPTEFLKDDKYKYQGRKLNYNNFQTSMFELKTSRKYEPIKKEEENGEINYTYKLKGANNFDSLVSKKDNSIYEKLDLRNGESINFSIDFNKPTKIRTIEFDHRSNNWWWVRPEMIKITDQDNNVLIDGKYDNFFKSSYMYGKGIFTLDKIHEVKNVNIKLYNTNGSTSQNGISLDAISVYDTNRLKINKTYSFNNSLMLLSGNWQKATNDKNTNISYFGGESLKSTSKNDVVEFYLFGSGFDIVGQKNNGNSSFDLYINDKLISTVDTNNNTRLDNTILYNHSNNDGDKPMKIKIVNKYDKTLFLDFIQTYGSYVYLDSVKNH